MPKFKVIRSPLLSKIKLDKNQVNPDGKIPADKKTTESKEEKEDKDANDHSH